MSEVMKRDLLEVARRNAERTQVVLSNRLKREARRVAMAAEHTTGATVKQLAEKHDLSEETVRADLKSAGVYTPQNRARITEEVRQAIVFKLQNGASVEDAATATGVSRVTVRKLGIIAGLLEKGTVRKRRSDEDMEEIAKLDEDVRAVHGVGLAALGSALATWRKKAAPVVASADEAPQGGDQAPESAEDAVPSDDAEDKPW